MKMQQSYFKTVLTEHYSRFNPELLQTISINPQGPEASAFQKRIDHSYNHYTDLLKNSAPDTALQESLTRLTEEIDN